MKQLLTIIVILFASVCIGAEPRVSYSLHAYAPNTSTPIESVKAGQEFDLALVVQDRRPEREPFIRGPFAAYCNVTYNKRFTTAKNFTPQSPFVNGLWKRENGVRVARVGVNNYGIAHWGGFTYGQEPIDDNGQPIPLEPLEVSRVRMTANWPAGTLGTSLTQYFRIDFQGLARPFEDTLLLGTYQPGGGSAVPGEQSTVTPGEISAVGVSVRILK